MLTGCAKGSRRLRFGDPRLDRFCLIHPCVGQTDGQTELRWLRRAESIAAFARKNQRHGQDSRPKCRQDQGHVYCQ